MSDFERWDKDCNDQLDQNTLDAIADAKKQMSELRADEQVFNFLTMHESSILGDLVATNAYLNELVEGIVRIVSATSAVADLTFEGKLEAYQKSVKMIVNAIEQSEASVAKRLAALTDEIDRYLKEVGATKECGGCQGCEGKCHENG